MRKQLLDKLNRGIAGLSRRDMIRGSAVLGFAPTLSAGSARELNPAREQHSSIYESVGVHPIINCRGTFTVVGGSLELPEVTAAQQAAAQHFVQLDELADGIGQRLAELTKAEWGMVSSGCAAGLAHATAACIAGGNPDLHVRIPNLNGFAKDEVVIPAHSRNEYDAAIRSIGVRITEVTTETELEAALGPRVAMIYVLAGPNAESGPLTYDVIYRIARQRKVPVLVDAAAEVLTIPNVHLERGATLVGYSGGKCIRGPQSAGLLLGRKDLVKAAWVHSAPHHGYGRTMKVGKEEAMGMLAAVEMWSRRDHATEYKGWMTSMANIAEAVHPIEGVKTEIRETKELSNQSPVLHIRWDMDKVGITGAEVEHTLFTTEPRITLSASGGRRFGHEPADNQTGVSITAYMMSVGEDKIVGRRLREVLGQAAGRKVERDSRPPASNLTGTWDVHIDFAASKTNHTFYLQQSGSDITGSHQGDFLARGLLGSMQGDQIEMVSSIGEQHGAVLTYTFKGQAKDRSLSGELSMGEYRTAKWTAVPHQDDFGGPGRA